MWEKLKKRYNEWKEESKIRMIDADAELIKKRYDNQKQLRVWVAIMAIIWLFVGILFLIGFVEIIDTYRGLDDSNVEVVIIMLSIALSCIISYLYMQHIVYIIYLKHADDNLAHISLIEKLNRIEKKLEEKNKNEN